MKYLIADATAAALDSIYLYFIPLPNTFHLTQNYMANGFFNVPVPINEPVKGYAPGSKEKLELQQQLKSLRGQELDIPMYINGQEVRTGKTQRINEQDRIGFEQRL